MTRLIRRPAIPVLVLTRRRPRADADAVSLVVSGSFLLFAIAYAVLKAAEVLQ